MCVCVSQCMVISCNFIDLDPSPYQLSRHDLSLHGWKGRAKSIGGWSIQALEAGGILIQYLWRMNLNPSYFGVNRRVLYGFGLISIHTYIYYMYIYIYIYISVCVCVGVRVCRLINGVIEQVISHREVGYLVAHLLYQVSPNCGCVYFWLCRQEDHETL